MEENVIADFEFDQTSFNVTATDTTLEPTNFRLLGVDASNFQISTSISSTADPEIFTVSLQYRTTRSFDFENPEDENQDNVYSFVYVFDYGDTTYATPVEISVTDVREPIAVEGSGFRLEFEPTATAVMPDVTGDGFPDVILLENEEMFFTSGVYVMSSQNVANSVGAPFDLVFDSDLFSRFVPSNQGFERLSTQPSADGQGFDMLYSNTFLDAYQYYDANNAADTDFLEGDVDPEAHSNNGVAYTRDDVNEVIDAQIIHDVNLDGQNDIFTYSNSTGEMGIRFGHAASNDTTRTADPDLILINNDFTGLQPMREITTSTFPDIDGDGNPELMIISPLYLETSTTGGNGAVWIVNSTAIASNPPSIDLDDASLADVRRVIGAEDENLGMSFDIITGADGEPYLLFGAGKADINVTPRLLGVSLAEFLNLARRSETADVAAVGADFVLTSDTMNGAQVTQPMGALNPIFDFDGDGLQDYLSSEAILVKGTDLLAGTNTVGAEFVIDREAIQFIGRGPNDGLPLAHVIDLSEQGFLGFFESRSGSEGDITFIATQDLIDAAASGQGDIIVTLPGE